MNGPPLRKQFTVRLAHRSQNFYHLISSQVKHTSIGSINVFIYWLVIQFFILAYNHLPSVLLSFWPDIMSSGDFYRRILSVKNYINLAKIRKAIIKFTALMQVWMWYSCLYWPALFCIFSDIYSVLLLKNAKKDLANIQTNWLHVRTIMHRNQTNLQ